jgi:hypothetical protein
MSEARPARLEDGAMHHPIVTTPEQARAAAEALKKVARELSGTAAEQGRASRSGEDTDETIDVRAGALPRHGVPSDVPDTQEALYAEDGAYRVDEVEGEGRRAAEPGELQVETDELHIIDEEDL